MLPQRRTQPPREDQRRQGNALSANGSEPFPSNTIGAKDTFDDVVADAPGPRRRVRAGTRPGTCDILREVGCDDAEIEATVAAKVLREENTES